MGKLHERKLRTAVPRMATREKWRAASGRTHSGSAARREGTCCGARWPSGDFRDFLAPEQVGTGRGAQGEAAEMCSASVPTIVPPA